MEIMLFTNYSKENTMQGRCPKCYSSSITYGDSVIEGESVGYHAQCDDCDAEFIEWYTLQYDESILTE